VQWIPDIFACLDRWMSLLLTDNASPGSSSGMMPGFLVEEGGGGKIGNCSDITYFTYCESGPETRDSFVYINNNNDVDNFIIVRVEEFSLVITNLGRKCIISEQRFVLELSISCAMLATARPSCYLCNSYKSDFTHVLT